MAIKSVQLVLNGVTHTLELDTSTNKYKKSITAPIASSYAQDNHVYAMVLNVEDMAGNIVTVNQDDAVYGDQMQLRVKERDAPLISIVTPGEGAYLTSNSVSISIDITDNDSGVATESISIKLDEKVVDVTKVRIANGVNCSYTGTVADGAHILSVYAEDNDGNVANEEVINFTVDTVPPALNVSEPASNVITNKQTCTVSGVTNDVTSGLASIEILLNEVEQGNVVVSSDGLFRKSVLLTSGENVIVVKATDKAGKVSIVSRNVMYDPDAPVILSIDVSPNPVSAGSNISITVEAGD